MQTVQTDEGLRSAQTQPALSPHGWEAQGWECCCHGVGVAQRWLAVTHGACCLSDLHNTMAGIESRSAPRAGSAFDGSCLNLPRFVQLMETFLGEGMALPAVEGLIGFIREEYKQTEEEKVKQLEKVSVCKFC